MGKYIKALVPVAIVALCGCISQRAILYQRGDYTLAEVKTLADREGLRLWPAATSSYRGLVSGSTAKPQKGTVVVFHGNAGIAAFRSYYASALGRLGYRVLLAEYPGYGGRPGRMSEKRFTTDAAEILKQAEMEFGRPLFVWGESLGSAVAAAAIAGDAPHPDGLVMFTPWDSLVNVARCKVPHLPVRLFMRDEYDNEMNLADYRGPIAVVLAGEDEVIPILCGNNLYNSLRGLKHRWIMQGAGHNNWPTNPSNPMWAEVMNYLNSSP